jgi:hypothetical protein
LHYADLEAKAAEVTTAFDDAADALKAAEKRLTDMAVLMKHIETYFLTTDRYTLPFLFFDCLRFMRPSLLSDAALVSYTATLRHYKLSKI